MVNQILSLGPGVVTGRVFAGGGRLWLAAVVAVGLVGVVPALTGSFAHAQTTYTWNGGGSDDFWTTADNWGGTAPVGAINNTILFDGTTRLTPNNDLAAGTGFLDLKFGATAGNFVLSGNSITLGNGASGSTIFNSTAPAGASITINNDLIINESIATFVQTFQNPAATVTLNGVISRDSSIPDNTDHAYSFGRGLRVLTNTGSSFDRMLLVRLAGTVRSAELLNAGLNSTIGSGNRIGLGNSGAGGTFEYTGGATETSRQIVLGQGTLDTHIGGGTILNNGTGGITFTNAAFNERYPSDPTTAAARTLALGGSSSGTNTISGVIAGNDTASGGIISLEKIDAASTWQFDGTNTYTGTTTVTAGTLLINGNQSAATGAVTVAAAGSRVIFFKRS